MNARRARWIEFLQDYTFTLWHKARVDNKAADTLSRCVFILNRMSIVVVNFKKITREYESCPDFCNTYAKLKYGITREVEGYILNDGSYSLFVNCVIPKLLYVNFLYGNYIPGG